MTSETITIPPDGRVIFTAPDEWRGRKARLLLFPQPDAAPGIRAAIRELTRQKEALEARLLEVPLSEPPDTENRRGTPAGMDETEYLMSNPANHRFLMEGIADMNAGRNLVTFNSLEELERYTAELVAGPGE